MKVEGAQPLLEALAAKKGAIIKEWILRTLQTYPEHTSRFFSQEKDPFRNPVGFTLAEAFPALLDQVIAGPEMSLLSRLLDPVVKMRAVQDFSAAQAVGFVFLLKKVIREALENTKVGDSSGEDLAIAEARIDEMALLAFDLFMRCREQIYEIKANEARRRLFVRDRSRREWADAG